MSIKKKYTTQTEHTKGCIIIAYATPVFGQNKRERNSSFFPVSLN